MTNNFETRKVQQTGGTSFIIGLPKEWVVVHNLRKNDTLALITQPDGNLLITPNVNPEELTKTKTYNVDEITEYNFLFRLLIGAYITGYTLITLKSSQKLKQFMKDCALDFAHIAIGLEIFEESSNYIIFKDLLDPKEMPFEKTIRRMYSLVESMQEDAISALNSKDKKLIQDIVIRDNDIDRLHWLVDRQTHIVFSDVLLCQKMDTTFANASFYQDVSRLLERVGDHAQTIAENVLKIMDKPIDAELIQKITNINKISSKILMSSLDTILKKDVINANKTIEAVKELSAACDDIHIDQLNISDISCAIGVSSIIESIRSIGYYAADISEMILDKLIYEQN